MDETILAVGLPVSCASTDCEAKTMVRPRSDYNGWCKARRYKKNNWYCPEHSSEAKALNDNKYKYTGYINIAPTETEEPVDELQELYNLID